MKLFSLLLALAGVSALVACAPRKKPDPKVTAADAAAVTAANEGVVATPAAAAAPGSLAPTGATSAAALPVIGPAPAWKLQDLNGAPVSSDQFKGKIVVVDFWATWCPPCRAEIPGYVDLAKKYGSDLVIVGVSLDQAGPKVVQDFVKKFGVNYPVVMGDDAVVSAFGGVEAIPTTFLIDRKGQIRDKKTGAEEAETYERKIKALL